MMETSIAFVTAEEPKQRLFAVCTALPQQLSLR